MREALKFAPRLGSARTFLLRVIETLRTNANRPHPTSTTLRTGQAYPVAGGDRSEGAWADLLQLENEMYWERNNTPAFIEATDSHKDLHA